MVLMRFKPAVMDQSKMFDFTQPHRSRELIAIFFFQLYSSFISSTGPQCTLRFFYWMGDNADDSIDSFHVFYNYQNSDNDLKELWSKSGFQGPGWHEARVFIGPVVNTQVSRLL